MTSVVHKNPHGILSVPLVLPLEVDTQPHTHDHIQSNTQFSTAAGRGKPSHLRSCEGRNIRLLTQATALHRPTATVGHFHLDPGSSPYRRRAQLLSYRRLRARLPPPCRRFTDSISIDPLQRPASPASKALAIRSQAWGGRRRPMPPPIGEAPHAGTLLHRPPTACDLDRGESGSDSTPPLSLRCVALPRRRGSRRNSSPRPLLPVGCCCGARAKLGRYLSAGATPDVFCAIETSSLDKHLDSRNFISVHLAQNLYCVLGNMYLLMLFELFDIVRYRALGPSNCPCNLLVAGLRI